MCGIIGYIGQKPLQEVLISGLKRMEYRGYDSAGVSSIDGQKINVVKSAGKLNNLVDKLDKKPIKGSVGIGHTRWATHGEPNETNAHPHKAGKVVIVHNGIIENYKELKDELLKKKVRFASETDTEVLAQLINKLYKTSSSLENAVMEALHRVRGTFGLVVMASDQPTKLVAARRGSPLVVGQNQDEVFVGSDPTALAGSAKEVMYLEDDEIAVCEPGSITVSDIHASPQDKQLHELDLEVEDMQKQGYDHFLIKEIMDQPDAVRAVTRGRLDPKTGNSHLGGLNLSDEQARSVERILISACGTANLAGLMSKYLLEAIVGVPVDVEVASEFRYREPVLVDNTLGIVISQSGETADTLAALKEMQNLGLHTLGLVNVVGSSIAREVDGGIYLHVGPEISVASTKAFTAMVVGAMLIGLDLARLKGLPIKQGKEIVKALQDLPNDIEKALAKNEEIQKLAQDLHKYENAFFIGRDRFYPVALEGALKLKEISYIHAEGYAGGEMKHGPIALLDDNFLTVALAGKSPIQEKMMSNIEEAKARKGRMVVITDDPKLRKNEDTICVPTSSDWTSPLVLNVVQQMLAYHMAVARGTDVDQPRNLAKSVTVE